MWKKKETETPAPTPEPRRDTPTAKPTPNPPRRTERAVIGPTLTIHGEITGEEELLVQGQIQGKIVVKGQAVTIGKSGRVKADIHARSIRVEGKVRGDLFGEQEIIIEASGEVLGNLIAPGVRLENGARFKGSIDMEQVTKTAVSPSRVVAGERSMPAKGTGEGEPGSASTPMTPGQRTLQP